MFLSRMIHTVLLTKIRAPLLNRMLQLAVRSSLCSFLILESHSLPIHSEHTSRRSGTPCCPPQMAATTVPLSDEALHEAIEALDLIQQLAEGEAEEINTAKWGKYYMRTRGNSSESASPLSFGPRMISRCSFDGRQPCLAYTDNTGLDGEGSGQIVNAFETSLFTVARDADEAGSTIQLPEGCSDIPHE